MMPKDFRLRIPAVGLAGCLLVLTAGCSKKSESNQAAAPNSPEVAELTKQVRRYSFEKRRLPQSLDELVAAGYIKAVPPAPTGKKYAIDAKQAVVIVVNQ